MISLDIELNGLLIISDWEFVRRNYISKEVKEEDLSDLLLKINGKVFFIISTSFQDDKMWQDKIKPAYDGDYRSIGWLINTLEHKKKSRYFHLEKPISLSQLKEILSEFSSLCSC